MTSKLRFYPWVRSGAAGSISEPDALSGALDANAQLSPWLRISGHTVEQSAYLRGPGHVVGLAVSAVVKTEPRDGTGDFEPNYFPFVELRPADLPWRFTPAAAGDRSQLRPWLVLVVVRAQNGVELSAATESNLAVLSIEPPAQASAELPDLADCAAWVHVQSTHDAADLAGALDSDVTAGKARLMCPRRLEANASWYACLVPAFDVGVHTGLGEDGATAAEANPAWDVHDPELDAGTLRLPVYASWSFSTGPDGDFEQLARRLEPDPDSILGRVDMDVTRPGPPLPDPTTAETALADFVGPLKSPSVDRRGAPAAQQSWLDAELEPLLDASAQRTSVPSSAPSDYDPVTDDPVVGPPLYGSLQAGREDVPDSTDPSLAWMRPLNLQLELRAAAGLGAEIVRRGQESFVASAWSQVGDARGAARALDFARLAAEAGRSIARRLVACDAGTVVQTTRLIQPWVDSPASSNTLSTDLRGSAIPRGLVSATFQRATRQRTALGRAWSRSVSHEDARDATAAAATSVLLSATGPGADLDLQATLEFAKTSLATGAWTGDPSIESTTTRSTSETTGAEPSAALLAAATAAGLAIPATRVEAEAQLSRVRAHLAALSVRPGIVARSASLDLSSAASAITAQADPLPHIQSSLIARIPGLASLLQADGALPRRILLSVVFDDALCWDLAARDPRYLLPGIEQLANNRVALLNVDNGTVAAFLVGANHEMSRELLWREFPTSPSGTFFRRFWDTGEGGSEDIDAISAWTQSDLGRNVTGVGAEELAVVIIRGDLVRRYPELHVYLCRGKWDENDVVPDAAELEEPVLQGALDTSTVFLGFPVSAEDMRGDRDGTSRTTTAAGWFVVFEEPSTGPRFGLDAAAEDGSDLVRGATAWSDLSWGHLVPTGGSVDDVIFAVAHEALPSRTPSTVDGVTWGHNAAHMAAITWQRPFRLYVHADRLLGA